MDAVDDGVRSARIYAAASTQSRLFFGVGGRHRGERAGAVQNTMFEFWAYLRADLRYRVSYNFASCTFPSLSTLSLRIWPTSKITHETASQSTTLSLHLLPFLLLHIHLHVFPHTLALALALVLAHTHLPTHLSNVAETHRWALVGEFGRW